MNWKECLWEWFIREIITEGKSAIIKWFIWFLIRLITKKILQLLKQNSKELIMKKESRTQAKKNKKKTPERNILQGYKKAFAVSMNQSSYDEITKEALERDLFIGQYLAMTHRFFMKHKRDDE